jgi:hypothetical protein
MELFPAATFLVSQGILYYGNPQEILTQNAEVHNRQNTSWQLNTALRRVKILNYFSMMNIIIILRSKERSYGICGGQSAIGLWFPMPILVTPAAPH